jgi:hypothetical protein
VRRTCRNVARRKSSLIRHSGLVNPYQPFVRKLAARACAGDRRSLPTGNHAHRVVTTCPNAANRRPCPMTRTTHSLVRFVRETRFGPRRVQRRIEPTTTRHAVPHEMLRLADGGYSAISRANVRFAECEPTSGVGRGLPTATSGLAGLRLQPAPRRQLRRIERMRSGNDGCARLRRSYKDLFGQLLQFAPAAELHAAF